MKASIGRLLGKAFPTVGPIVSPLRVHVTTQHSGIHTASGPSSNGVSYWQRIKRWQTVAQKDFIDYRWQLSNTIRNEKQLIEFLTETLPEELMPSKNARLQHIKTREEFINDARGGLKKAPMAISLTPHTLSVINWQEALDDPIRLQFLPLESGFIADHSSLTLDSLHEEADSPVKGLVHRYPDKALFLATSICPVYCRFCTRSYAVGGNTETVSKAPMKGGRRRWQLIYDYLKKTPVIQDIVVSGGDTYYLDPNDVWDIGKTLLEMDHIRRIRFASKGLAVVPSRTIDPNDAWTHAFIKLSQLGRKMGKQVCLHTHINHPNEITWITKDSAKYLFEHGVIVRNQTVLLKGVNDNVETMGTLIRTLADMNIQPYYVYQCDLVKGIEDLRTPLSTILDIEEKLRGTIAGFMMPSFVVDLPGGGGKRLAAAGVYDHHTGISKFTAPGLLGMKAQRTYVYHDPKEPDTIKNEKHYQLSVGNEEAQKVMLDLEERDAPALGAGRKVGKDHDPATANSSHRRPTVTNTVFPGSPPNKFNPTIWAPIKHNEVAPKAQ